MSLRIMKGIYVLILELDRDTIIRVGKLGNLNLGKGFYAYVGSALGTGGFSRVARHFDVASGKNMTRKWHIDYLLPCSKAVCSVLIPTDERIECSVAWAIGESCNGIPGFGCSDCSCHTHLFFSETDLTDRVAGACKALSGNESIITGKTI